MAIPTHTVICKVIINNKCYLQRKAKHGKKSKIKDMKDSETISLLRSHKIRQVRMNSSYG